MYIRKILLTTLIIVLIGLFKTSLVTAQTSCPIVPTDKGTIVFSTTTTDGTYRVWSRMKASDSNNNSFYFKIDNNCAVLVGDSSQISSTSLTWVDYKDGNTSGKIDVALTAGGHVITLYGNESGVFVDKMILTKNLSCIPTDFGTNCPSELPTSTPTPVPFSFVSNPQATNITNSSANITWSLSEGATGQVEYGLTTSYGQFSVKEQTFTNTTHNQSLTGLSSGRVYHYRVISENASGAQVISGDATFTTLQNTPTPTQTPTPTPTLKPTSTPTYVPSPTPTPTPIQDNFDNVPPTIIITNPTNLALVLKKNITNILANVTDNNAVSHVEFYVNDKLLCRNFTLPYSCSWAVPPANFKLYKITVKAFDFYQNTSSSTIWVYSTWR